MSIKIEQNQFDCPECGGILKHDGGETYCNSCGLVVEDSMINRQLKPPFKNEEEKLEGRGETTQAIHDKTLGSQISYKNKDNRGNHIPKRQKEQMNRMREYQRTRQFKSKDQWKRKGLGEVHRLHSAMDLPDSLVESAATIFNKAHNEDLAFGRSIDAIANVSVYLAAKIHGNIRDMDEWIANSSVNETKFKNTLATVQTELDIGYLPSSPMDHVNGMLSQVDVTTETRKQTLDLVKEVQEKTAHIGRKPKGVVAACLYLSSNRLTQEDVAELADVTPRTIRKNIENIEA